MWTRWKKKKHTHTNNNNGITLIKLPFFTVKLKTDSLKKKDCWNHWCWNQVFLRSSTFEHDNDKNHSTIDECVMRPKCVLHLREFVVVKCSELKTKTRQPLKNMFDVCFRYVHCGVLSYSSSCMWAYTFENFLQRI